MSEKPKPSTGNEGVALGAILAIVAGGTVWQKYGRAAHEMWQIHGWKFLVVVALSATFSVLLASMVVFEKVMLARDRRAVTRRDSTSVYLGVDERGKAVNLKQAFRGSHTQVIGTTNAGKTESIILPWAIQDIENNSGLIIVDGKGDKSFLNKLYAYVVKCGRAEDFKMFSLAHIEPSSTFNPLIGGTPTEVAERVFSSFPIEHPHYRAVQACIFQALLTLIRDRRKIPTFILLHRMLSDQTVLVEWLLGYDDINPSNYRFIESFNSLPHADRSKEVSGLAANLMHFVTGPAAPLFNATKPQIDFDKILEEGKICYFQLPTMYCPFLAEATGKLVLQCFQQAVSKRQLKLDKPAPFFSCFLDDFQDYIYPGFGALLNKSRSANIGVVFSHQALGDLDKVGPEFRNVVSTCTNIKVIMRSNEPESCEYYAKTFGTKTTNKVTERQKRWLFFTSKTGDGSARDAEEYLLHPNTMRQMERGQGAIAIPHPLGVKHQIVRFKMRPNLPVVPLPKVPKPKPRIVFSLPQKAKPASEPSIKSSPTGN